MSRLADETFRIQLSYCLFIHLTLSYIDMSYTYLNHAVTV